MNSSSCVSPKECNYQNDSQPQNTTLRIRSIKHLALILGISKESLFEVANNTSSYYREFSAEIKGKRRNLIEAHGKLVYLQRKILKNLLLRLKPFESSFGAVKGKSIKDNALVHKRSLFIAKLDIKDFYPSIHSTKVYDFFVNEQQCSPDVARILTKLTTKNYKLPLGTTTSPMLADQIVRKIDGRIYGMAKKAGLKYTRYVDDITISSNFELDRIVNLIIGILKQAGFKVKKEKIVFYGPNEPFKERVVTGVSIKKGRVTAPKEYTECLELELKDAIKQSRRSKLTREFMSRQHYYGRIGYVRWLDEKKGGELYSLYRKVKWKHLEWMLANNMIVTESQQTM